MAYGIHPFHNKNPIVIINACDAEDQYASIRVKPPADKPSYIIHHFNDIPAVSIFRNFSAN